MKDTPGRSDESLPIRRAHATPLGPPAADYVDDYQPEMPPPMAGKRISFKLFTRALRHGSRPTEVSTDRARAYPRVLDELLPATCHVTEQYANNPIEADHGRLKSRLRPMRGLKRLRSAQVISAGHAFVQNLRHYELATHIDPRRRLPVAFAEIVLAL